MKNLFKKSLMAVLCSAALLGATESNGMNRWERFKNYCNPKIRILDWCEIQKGKWWVRKKNTKEMIKNFVVTSTKDTY